jgi:hypothetical protein
MLFSVQTEKFLEITKSGSTILAPTVSIPEVVVLMLHRADTFLDRRVVISQSTGEPLVSSCSPDHESLRESLSQPSRYGESGVVLYSYLFSLPIPLSLKCGVLGLRLERVKDTHRKRIYTAAPKGAMNVTSVILWHCEFGSIDRTSRRESVT